MRTNCQVLDYHCPDAMLCTRCHGSGEEPTTPSGSDPCCQCDHCYDEAVGWSTGVEPGTQAARAVRDLTEGSGWERCW